MIIIAHMSKVILGQLLPAKTLSIFLCSDAYLDTYWMSQTFVLNFWLPTSQSLCLGFVVFSSPSLAVFSLSACVAVSITCGYCKCLTAIKAINVWKLEQDRVSNNSTPAKYLQPWNLVQVEWRTEEKMSQNNSILSRTVRFFFFFSWNGLGQYTALSLRAHGSWCYSWMDLRTLYSSHQTDHISEQLTMPEALWRHYHCLSASRTRQHTVGAQQIFVELVLSFKRPT